MAEPLAAGLTWQQLLAFGVVGLFAGAVKLLDLLYQPAASRPLGSVVPGYGDDRVLEQQRQPVWSLDE